jgi:hypothetical protein
MASETGVALRIVCLCLALAAAGCAAPATEWDFQQLDRIGGAKAVVEGQPQLMATPAGTAVLFDGKDALFVAEHPLAGAKTFTAEAVFRPDDGPFEQRWLHLAETDASGADTGTRFLFEVRVKDGQWYLDSFVNGPGYNKALMTADKPHPLGPWYRAEMSYDGTIFRSYVDGVLQTEAAIAFKPQGAGHTSIGTRINRVDYFHGAVLKLRFTPRALPPEEFLPLPAGLNPPGKAR